MDERQQWLEWARNPRFSMWERVASLAYALEVDGHASFNLNEIRGALGDPNMPHGSVANGLTHAREFGYLDPRSCARCLVVPGAGDDCWGFHRDVYAAQWRDELRNA